MMLVQAINDEVLEACRSGDTEAFRLLFESYRDRVYSIAYSFFNGDGAAADDVTQQVFVKLMSQISQFQARSQFSTWLYRLVTNACLDHKRGLRRYLLFGDSSELPKKVDVQRSAESTFIATQIEAQVRDAVATLKPKLRIAVLLKYFDDLSYDEMAAALSCSRGTVASRLNRGHRMLAQKLRHLRGQLAAGD
jgi:RNA polymerase sigma-70 factor (ECF subfamily)